MNRLFIPLLTMLLFSSCNMSKMLNENKSKYFNTPFEKNNETSSSYQEAIKFYKILEPSSKMIQVNEFGMTDSGNPLHEVILSKDKIFTPQEVAKSGKVVLMVNNGIHAGEPCGIDASMMLARDLINSKTNLLDSTVVIIVPVYNIGGSLNRGGFSRANQNGPKEYGFRGNSKNLDLNRDFIKSDSENARSFNRLFNKWNPDIFIDNHTSNGADYQYVITLIATQKDKIEANLSRFMVNDMLPDLYAKMNDKKYEMTPYVNVRNTPDEGIAAFLDLPRYSSGYAVLHNTISFMPETHMFKPYKDRVWSTYYFMESMLEYINVNKEAIQAVRRQANNNVKIQERFDLNWELDFDVEDQLLFKGYVSKTKKSKVTGLDRMYYDRSDPFEKMIPFYNTYKSTLTIEKPKSYIIPQAYKDIIEKLKVNGVKIEQIPEDQIMNLQVYRIEDYQTAKSPYEGHYIHSKVQLSSKNEDIQLYAGDFIVNTDQIKNRYIIETLEPQAPDSWFAWNFFDGILMQKEYFSPYVFEELAEELLKKDRKLKNDFEEKLENEPEFKESSYQQLNYIYEHSPYYEKTYKRYPVYRKMD